MQLKLYKKWYFWFIMILTIISIICILYFSNRAFGVGSAGISLDEFEKIKVNSTTNYELNSIIDSNNEWNDNDIYKKCVEEISTYYENSKYTYIYKYYGEKGGYAIITLQADYSNGYYHNDLLVTKKEQFNLK